MWTMTLLQTQVSENSERSIGQIGSSIMLGTAILQDMVPTK